MFWSPECCHSSSEPVWQFQPWNQTQEMLLFTRHPEPPHQGETSGQPFWEPFVCYYQGCLPVESKKNYCTGERAVCSMEWRCSAGFPLLLVFPGLSLWELSSTIFPTPHLWGAWSLPSYQILSKSFLQDKSSECYCFVAVSQILTLQWIKRSTNFLIDILLICSSQWVAILAAPLGNEKCFKTFLVVTNGVRRVLLAICRLRRQGCC